MHSNQLIEDLLVIRLKGMAKGLEDQLRLTETSQLSFEERMALLIDREKVERENRRLKRRLSQARLKHNASVEDIDFRTPRNIDKSVFLSLASCDWVARHQNVIITGPTGIGKSYLANALAQKACREGFQSSYQRVSLLLSEMAIARGDGRYHKLLEKLSKVDVLLLDDWGLQVLNESQCRDIMEIVEDRYNVRSTIITSQFSVERWHELFCDPTMADAILDRLVHNAHHIQMKGDSMRKKINSLDKGTS